MSCWKLSLSSGKSYVHVTNQPKPMPLSHRICSPQEMKPQNMIEGGQRKFQWLRLFAENVETCRTQPGYPQALSPSSCSQIPDLWFCDSINTAFISSNQELLVSLKFVNHCACWHRVLQNSTGRTGLLASWLLCEGAVPGEFCLLRFWDVREIML